MIGNNYATRMADESALVIEATNDMCGIYRRERNTRNVSPWLAHFMADGAKSTADAAQCLVSFNETTDTDDRKKCMEQMWAIRLHMQRARAAMVAMFDE